MHHGEHLYEMRLIMICIHWDKRALCKVVKDAIPNCIRDKLCYSVENVSSFEGFKRAVLCINNNYWKKVQDDKNKSCTSHSPQYNLPKPLRQEPTRNPWSEEKTTMTERSPKFLVSLGTSSRLLPPVILSVTY